MTEEVLPPQPGLPGMTPGEPPMPEFPPDDVLFPEAVVSKTPGEEQVKFSASWTPTEAPASFYTVMHMPDGGWISMTVRGDSPIVTLDAFMGMRDAAIKKYGVTAVQNKQAEQSGTPIPHQTVPPGGQAIPPNVPADPSSAPHPNTESDTGSFEIAKIQVNPDGVIEFTIPPFKWPVKDSRPPTRVAQVFDQTTGVDASWLSSAKIFEPPKFGQVWMADWKLVVKGGKKYYNIERVWVKSRQP